MQNQSKVALREVFLRFILCLTIVQVRQWGFCVLAFNEWSFGEPQMSSHNKLVASRWSYALLLLGIVLGLLGLTIVVFEPFQALVLGFLSLSSN